jgi:hypothetical protein
MGRVSRRLTTPIAGVLLVVATLALSSCSVHGSSKPTPTPKPSPAGPSVAVPPGVKLTAAGATLALGSAATVPYAPNSQRSTVLSISVDKVMQASIKDFAAYVLSSRIRDSTPYYVYVHVANLGKGDVGDTDIPLWAVNQSNVLIHSSSFTNSFGRCPSPTLPKKFAHGAKLTTCLVYLLPDHGVLRAVSFRPLEAYAPIDWKGTVELEHPAKAAHKSGKAKNKKAKK